MHMDWVSEVEVLQKKVNLKKNEVDSLEKLDSEAKKCQKLQKTVEEKRC